MSETERGFFFLCYFTVQVISCRTNSQFLYLIFEGLGSRGRAVEVRFMLLPILLRVCMLFENVAANTMSLKGPKSGPRARGLRPLVQLVLSVSSAPTQELGC